MHAHIMHQPTTTTFEIIQQSILSGSYSRSGSAAPSHSTLVTLFLERWKEM